MKASFDLDSVKIESEDGTVVYQENSSEFSSWSSYKNSNVNWEWVREQEQPRFIFLDFINEKLKEYSQFLYEEKRKIVEKETAQKQGSFPQTDLPKGSVLLGSMFKHGHMYRAYSRWVEEEHFNRYFVTEDGGIPQYTRRDAYAKINFMLFYDIMSHGLLTEAGKRYLARHEDAKYGREKVYGF